MRDYQLRHEGLQTKVLILLLLLAHPPLHETNHLSEMVLLQCLPDANELEVQRNARKHRLSPIEGKEIAPVVGITAVLNWDDVHIQATYRIADADRVPVHLDLIGLHLRVSFADPLRQPFQKLSFFAGDLLALHVEGDVDVIQRLKSCALRQTAGVS